MLITFLSIFTLILAVIVFFISIFSRVQREKDYAAVVKELEVTASLVAEISDSLTFSVKPSISEVNRINPVSRVRNVAVGMAYPSLIKGSLLNTRGSFKILKVVRGASWVEDSSKLRAVWASKITNAPVEKDLGYQQMTEVIRSVKELEKAGDRSVWIDPVSSSVH